VVHDDKVAAVVVGNGELVEDLVGRLADHHAGEQLATNPGTTARGNGRLSRKMIIQRDRCESNNAEPRKIQKKETETETDKLHTSIRATLMPSTLESS
jgi:hypothetical protein